MYLFLRKKPKLLIIVSTYPVMPEAFYSFSFFSIELATAVPSNQLFFLAVSWSWN